jgi:hypothetical protein
MGPLEQIVQESELVHQLQCGGMYRVAAKIPKEVGMLLQYDDIDAGAREKESQHHAGRAAANNATIDIQSFGGL